MDAICSRLGCGIVVRIFRYGMSWVTANIVRSEINCGHSWWVRFGDDNYIIFYPTDPSPDNFLSCDTKFDIASLDDMERDIALRHQYAKALERRRTCQK